MGFLEVVSGRIDGLGHHPDKQKINALSATAKDVLAGNVAGVSSADFLGLILKKIYRAEAKAKVPLWYLTDSILFNVGGDYIFHIQKELPMLFKDSYSYVNADDKKRLDRLLYRWEQRKRFISKDVLHETRARLHPDFKQAEYREYVRQKKARVQIQQPIPQVVRPSPQILPQFQEQVEQHFLDEGEYWTAVESTTTRLLKDLQRDESEESQLTLSMVKQLKPELYDVLRQNAQDELKLKGVFCRNPNFINIDSKVKVKPTDLNWDIEYLRSGSGLFRVLDDLFGIGGGEIGSEDSDELTGLTFSSSLDKSKYYSHYVVSSDNLLTEIRNDYDPLFEDERTCSLAKCSRAPLLPLDQWKELGEEFSQVYAILREELKKEEVVEVNQLPKVIADDKFSSCAITGEKFQKEYDHDQNEWVYLNAVRPVPGGPIYLSSAYSQQKKRGIEDDISQKSISKKFKG